MTIGMNRETGKVLSGRDHLEQSVADILTTPIGSRVMNREYGSRLFELVDTPVNELTKPDFFAATIEALARWEPRLRVTRVTCVATEPGKIEIGVDGVDVISGNDVSIEGIVI